MNFGVLLNKTISEWQGQNFPCYNKMNRNEARTVADQIVWLCCSAGVPPRLMARDDAVHFYQCIRGTNLTKQF